MRWENLKIGDIVDLKQGFAVNSKSNHYISKEGLPLLKISDLINGTETLFVRSDIPKQFLVYEHEIIYSRTGQVGLVFMGRKGVVYNNCFKITPKKGVDSKFLYFLLTMPHYRDVARSLATGAAQPDLNHGAFKSINITLPPFPIQQKISCILAAYVDLIENNLKQIKLLEEMAQITYEEWFVRFRFPDHESTPINTETGLPQGWYKTKLGEMCEITMGQSPKSEFYNLQANGIPFHQGVKDYGARFPTNACWSTNGSRFAERGDILFSVRAPVGRLNIALEKMILGRGLAGIRHKDNAQGFLYCLLKKQFFEEDMMGGGAIFNSVTKNDMHRIELVAPSSALLKNFNEIVNIIDRQIEILHCQNVRLGEARDILLPRLMTGLIDIETYDPSQFLKDAA